LRQSGCVLLLIFCCCAIAQPDTNANTHQPSLRTAHLLAQTRKDIVAAIAEDFPDQPKESPSGEQIALGSWVSFVRLSKTGPAAILITSGPDDPDNGATGNGDFWLFKRIGGNHAFIILRAGGFSAHPRRGAYHKGMLGFQTATNTSCCQGDIEVFRFDGVRYKLAICFSYTEDKDGKMKYGPHGNCED
jgi:hypothetical protein